MAHPALYHAQALAAAISPELATLLRVPELIEALAILPPPPADDDEIIVEPALFTLRETFIVTAPQSEQAPPDISPTGGISIGADTMDGAAVINVALHHRDGRTLVASMGIAGYIEFANAMNDAVQQHVNNEGNT